MSCPTCGPRRCEHDPSSTICVEVLIHKDAYKHRQSSARPALASLCGKLGAMTDSCPVGTYLRWICIIVQAHAPIPDDAWEYQIRKSLNDAAYQGLDYVPYCTTMPVQANSENVAFMWVSSDMIISQLTAWLYSGLRTDINISEMVYNNYSNFCTSATYFASGAKHEPDMKFRWYITDPLVTSCGSIAAQRSISISSSTNSIQWDCLYSLICWYDAEEEGSSLRNIITAQWRLSLWLTPRTSATARELRNTVAVHSTVVCISHAQTNL